MKPNTRKLVVIAVVVVVLAGAGYAVWQWRPANTANYPDGTFWICRNPACNNEFVMSVRDYAAFQEKHYGEATICPKCGKQDTVAAKQCPNCKRLYPRGDRSPNAKCPHCKKPLGTT